MASVTDNRFEASSSGTGIDINTGTATISDNVFVNAITTGVTDTGIRVDGATATIADNDFNGIGIAIQLGADSAAPNTQVTGNEITGVHLGTITGFGILAQRSTGVVVTDNEISAPASLAGTNGIQVSGSGSPASAQLRRNQVYDHGRGVFLSDLASATMDDDLLAGNATGLTAFDDTGVGSGDVAVKNLTVTDAAPGATEDVFVFGTDADLSLDSSIVGDLGIAASAGELRDHALAWSLDHARGRRLRRLPDDRDARFRQPGHERLPPHRCESGSDRPGGPGDAGRS